MASLATMYSKQDPGHRCFHQQWQSQVTFDVLKGALLIYPPSELSFVLQSEYRSKCTNLPQQVRNKSPQVIQFS
jgi:hypothetical protein